MAAPGPPVLGTAAIGTGASVTPTLPASVAADDILLAYAVAHGTVTSITFPAGYTRVRNGQITNSAAAAVGRAAWAWARAAGGESGTISISRDGTTGNTTFFAANVCRIPGCETSGNPYSLDAINNPNASTTMAFPSLTPTTGSDFMSQILALKGGLNGNITTPTNWTALDNQTSTTGSDGAMDADYRQITAYGGGGLQPASQTTTTDTDTGWATFQIIFVPPAAVTAPPHPTITNIAATQRAGAW